MDNDAKFAWIDREIDNNQLSMNNNTQYVRIMTFVDVMAFIEIAAQTYKCSPSAISYKFEPIVDNGYVSFDEIMLIFTLDSIVDYELTTEVIHSVRIEVPQEVKKRMQLEYPQNI